MRWLLPHTLTDTHAHTHTRAHAVAHTHTCKQLIVLAQASSAAESPAILLFGVTVGDVAYWVDSLLMAGLLRFAARPFQRVAAPPVGPVDAGANQMGYVFQVGLRSPPRLSYTRSLCLSLCPPRLSLSVFLPSFPVPVCLMRYSHCVVRGTPGARL
jgi:hypothetical protein